MTCLYENRHELQHSKALPAFPETFIKLLNPLSSITSILQTNYGQLFTQLSLQISSAQLKKINKKYIFFSKRVQVCSSGTEDT